MFSFQTFCFSFPLLLCSPAAASHLYLCFSSSFLLRFPCEVSTASPHAERVSGSLCARELGNRYCTQYVVTEPAAANGPDPRLV